MPKIFKRHCNTCGKYYESKGKKYCSRKCQPSPIKGKKGHKSWNLGLTKETDERIRKSSKKSSKTKKGKVTWNKGIKGSTGNHKGKVVSESTKLILSEKRKEYFKLHPDKHPMKGKHHTPESCQKISENHADFSGSNNPSYIDGRSFESYCPKFNEELKQQVRLRDSYTCQLCGKLQIENYRKLDVHHIHYDKQNCYPDLICLCNSCNSKVNKKSLRSYYESLFMNKLNERCLLFWTKYRNRQENP